MTWQVRDMKAMECLMTRDDLLMRACVQIAMPPRGY